MKTAPETALLFTVILASLGTFYLADYGSQAQPTIFANPDLIETNVENAFSEWKQQFQPKWGVEQEFYRKLVFNKNFDIIRKHNANKSHTYKMAVNKFTALTQQQFQNGYLMPRIPVQTTEILSGLNGRSLLVNPNININWTAKGMVSPVENQGACGGCYSFSATGVMESYARINNLGNVQLSQQQILDCSQSFGNNGCSGGLAIQALQYVLKYGITSEAQYPYRMVSGICQMQGGSFQISSIKQTYGCTGLLMNLQNQPISIAVSANNWNWYGSGVFANCINTSNDHAVLLVGATNEYWIVKNSWGPSWGENGFIRLAPGNTCGLCAQTAPWVE